jgi:Tol biopolymer transport system component
MFATVALAAVSGLAVLAISMSDSSRAAFPGANGRVAYSYGDGYSGSIWSVNADGTSLAKLTNGSNDYGPSYSANGGKIAFERENGVAVMNSDGAGQTQLLFGNYSSSSEPPEWQSEYQNPEKPSETIPFVKIQTFTEAWHTFTSPSFSPDGSQLVVLDRSGEFIYTLTCAVEEEEGSECISGYEGGHYFYDEECIACNSRIITVSSTSGTQTAEVTPASNSYNDYEPTFSAGGKIAFSRWNYLSGKTEIYVVNSPGAAPLQITNGPYDYAPDFSPDGSRIAFTRGEGEIGMVGVGGGPLTVLSVPNPAGVKHSYVESVAFSPDGSRIALGRRLNPTGGKSEHCIYTMGVDGASLVKVADGSAPDWQPNSPPATQAPAIPFKGKATRHKVKLSKGGKGSVGTIVCGSSPCTLKVLSATLKAGKKICPVKTKLPKRLGPGESARVRIRVVGKCLAALKGAGKGSLVVRVQVSDALGKKVLKLKSTLTAGKAKKHDKK